MTVSALRVIACAGALSAGLLLGGPPIAATAQQEESTDSGGVDGASAPSGEGGDAHTPDPSVAGGAGAPSGAPADEGTRPTSTIGDGRNDVVDPNAPIERGQVAETGETRPAPRYRPSPDYFAIFEIPGISIGDIMRALVPPKPKPAPSPAFRTQQQEEPSVIDATPNGGGSGHPAASADTPTAFEVPLVSAPRLPVGSTPLLAPESASAAAGPASGAGGQPVVAGVNTPAIRGSLPPSGEQATASRSLTMNEQTTRFGYTSYLRTPTVGELSVVALPGLGGLMFLTFSGGVIGYRQANSARFVRTTGAARFLE